MEAHSPMWKAMAPTALAPAPIAVGSAAPPRTAARPLSVGARFGLARIVNALSGGGLPCPFEAEVQAKAAIAGNLESTLDEYVDADDAVRQAAMLSSPGDKPLVVLTAVIG